MTFMNSNANIKQFQLLKFINENCDDDHVMSKSSIVLRRDKIEAPYYMVVKIKASTCVDSPKNGLIHAMDMLSHHRRHNLAEETYNEIRSLIVSADKNSGDVKISESDSQLNMVLMSRSGEEFKSLFKTHQELFEKIDSLTGR